MFFIPLAVDLFIFNYLEMLAIASNKNEYLFSLVFYSMVIMIPCMMIGFLGFAGAFYVAKKWPLYVLGQINTVVSHNPTW